MLIPLSSGDGEELHTEAKAFIPSSFFITTSDWNEHEVLHDILCHFSIN